MNRASLKRSHPRGLYLRFWGWSCCCCWSGTRVPSWWRSA